MATDRSHEPLTRKDTAVYWLLRLMPCGVLAYDWRAEWRCYLRTRSFWRAW